MIAAVSIIPPPAGHKTRHPPWRPFVEARTFARSLGLATAGEWRVYANSGRSGLPPLPRDIPPSPSFVYRILGWVDWPDWLGENCRTVSRSARIRRRTHANQVRFIRDRKFVHGLHLVSRHDWMLYCLGARPDLPPKPRTIPDDPSAGTAYGGWFIHWADWLGLPEPPTGGSPWRPAGAAREFVHSLHLRSAAEWADYCAGRRPELPARPADIPASPAIAYARKGWTNWPDWLGYAKANGIRPRRPYAEAREFVRSLKLRSAKEWRDYARNGLPGLPPKPADIPSKVAECYRSSGWRGFNDWLGTTPSRRKTRLQPWRPFAEAREFIRSRDFRTQLAFRVWCRDGPKPIDIPMHPDQIYLDSGWAGWADWLGKARVRSGPGLTPWRPYGAARQFVSALGLRNKGEWIAYCAGQRPDLPPIPADIPSTPRRTYQNHGWLGWPHWLDNFRQRTLKPWRTFAEAREFVRERGFRTVAEFRTWSRSGKMPADIPTCPNHSYLDAGWINWTDWLGKDLSRGRGRRPKTQWRPFTGARAFALRLAVPSGEEWKAYCAGQRPDLPPIPADIPSNPQLVYAEQGWRNWYDWLGNPPKRTKPRDLPWRPFTEARSFVHSLHLQREAEWHAYMKGKRPDLPPPPADIPSYPTVLYRLKGWRGWRDWLGSSGSSAPISPPPRAAIMEPSCP
ncbi:MAG: hypothetical protein PHE83_18565 [Opitutaceae bacterium]|nr:hypothetical protein [Opitutaceae bacterium]